MDLFLTGFKKIQAAVHEIAIQKGWWETDNGDPAFIANVHGECSEYWEASRQGNPMSKKIPGFTAKEEEIADIVIRCMDTAEKRKHRLSEAIIAKMEYNKTRSHRHGGKLF